MNTNKKNIVSKNDKPSTIIGRMAKESGYTMLMHPMTDTLMKLNLSTAEFRLMLYVIRHTIGFRKTHLIFRLKNIMTATDISRPSIYRAKTTLITRNMIKVVSINGEDNIEININVNEWILDTNNTTINTPVLEHTPKPIGRNPYLPGGVQ